MNYTPGAKHCPTMHAGGPVSTTHHICQAAITVSCPCGASAGQPCDCEPGHIHVARACACATLGFITTADAASVIYPDADGFFSGMQTIADPGGFTEIVTAPGAIHAAAPVGAL